MQMAVFEQLKVTGLLCSRFSATVKKGRRFFTLKGVLGDKPRDFSQSDSEKDP